MKREPGTCIWLLTVEGREMYCGVPCEPGYVYCALHLGRAAPDDRPEPLDPTESTDADLEREHLARVTELRAAERERNEHAKRGDTNLEQGIAEWKRRITGSAPEGGSHLCMNSPRPFGGHSWRFDGDDPYLVCVGCGQRRDALTGRLIGTDPA